MSSVLRKVYYYLFVRESKWNMLIILIPLVLISLYIYVKRKPIKKGNYTIGYVSKVYWPIVSHKKATYVYVVNKKEYSNTQIYNNAEEGKYYLVQFSLEDNSVSDIFQDIPIPDSIKSAPAEGWKELPEWAKKENE
ncbi:hypothetical protein [Bergeyella sp. RCAD1439]|uniref:hypothetical protein n=1 Tax=Bergeyella anatis TaxID=3113737 RepID=UPI002E17B144|nr:hypothetical protein [Bergeyella sp. RCAD1439]